MTAAKSLNEARAKRQQTAFLCHSHQDNILADGLQILLNENGWNLYIDWQDTAMPEKPTRETAIRIQDKIKSLDWFLYLATPNSILSKWCPWEIGFADNAKPHNKIMIIPTTDRSGVWYGNEYLRLYRRIDAAQGGILAAFDEGEPSGGTYIKSL
jgi:hypothetical protein